MPCSASSPARVRLVIVVYAVCWTAVTDQDDRAVSAFALGTHHFENIFPEPQATALPMPFPTGCRSVQLAFHVQGLSTSSYRS